MDDGNDIVMYELSPPGRRLVVPVIPADVPAEGPCAACGTCSGLFLRRVIGRRDATVCLNAEACRDRITLRVLDGPL